MFSRLPLSIVLRRAQVSAVVPCEVVAVGERSPTRDGGGGSVTTGVARKARSRSAGTDRYIPHGNIHEINTWKCPIQTQCFI